METSTVNAGLPTLSRNATTRGFGDLSGEDFFQLMIAELQSQDPLNPTDNQQLLNQMASIRQMEQSSTLNKTLLALAGEQRFGATASLIGHYVSGTLTNDAGDTFEIQGVVIGVRFEADGSAILELHNGQSLPTDKVDQVTLVENLPEEILAQLQEELGLDGTDGEGDGAAAAARSIVTATKAGQPTPGDYAREFADRADTAAVMLETLLSPGVSIGI